MQDFQLEMHTNISGLDPITANEGRLATREEVPIMYIREIIKMERTDVKEKRTGKQGKGKRKREKLEKERGRGTGRGKSRVS